MGTLTGTNIIDRAWIKSNDTSGAGGVRWPAAEALKWLNDAQREIVNQLPKSNPVRVAAAMVSGTRQTLTGLSLTTGLAVIDVVRNVGGRAITKRDRAWFDDQRPDWHTETAAASVHWMYDERDPKAFYLWPPAVNAASVELIYSALPTDLTALTDTITLDDIYANAMQFFVLFSFYSKDAVYTKSPQFAAQYWGLFMQSLGFRDKAVVMAAQQGDKLAAGV
jgi:hypothetical protein